MRNCIIAAALICYLGTGCIPKGKYDDIMQDQSRLYDRIDGMKNAMAQMSTELKRLKTQIANTEAELDENKRKLAVKVIETGQLAEDVETMRAAIDELKTRETQAEATLEAYKDLLRRFQTMIDSGTLRVQVVDGRMVVALPTDVLFAPGSASLSTEGRDAVDQVASVLASIPDRDYQVAGHTDDRPISNESFASNWHLGAARAIAVTKLLVGGGLPSHRVSAASFGDTKPIDTNRSTEGRANNRRIEIIIVPDLSQLPGYTELQALADSSDSE
jgi:chemotaxis protein MotB